MKHSRTLLSLLLALALVFALGANALAADIPQNTFTDVSRSAWYAEAVDFAQSMKLMNGVGNNRFDPEGVVTRAMVVTVLYRMAEEPKVDGLINPFTDVPSGTWYTNAVIWAVDEGITNGDGAKDIFHPNTPITREQMATMIVRFMMAVAGEDNPLTQIIDADPDGSFILQLLREQFKDADAISDYARLNVELCKTVNIMKGDDTGTFRPQSTLTRAECAQTLKNFYAAAGM